MPTSRFPPIKRLVVDAGVPLMGGVGIAIQWEVHPDYKHRELHFHVLFGNYPTAEFSEIAVVEDADTYVDNTKRIFHDIQSAWYAVKTVDAQTGEYWYSDPQSAGSAWRKREWSIAREVVRQETVRLQRVRAGTRGYLLRRKMFGEKCPVCLSPETGQITNPQCQTCYGTGLVGGYFPATEYWVDLQPERMLRRLDPQQGHMTDKVVSARALAYPPANPNDYWVSAKSNQRYRIGEQVLRVAQIDEEPLILQYDLSLEHYNHVIYTVPVPGL